MFNELFDKPADPVCIAAGRSPVTYIFSYIIKFPNSFAFIIKHNSYLLKLN